MISITTGEKGKITGKVEWHGNRFLLKYNPTMKAASMTSTQHTVMIVNLQRALLSAVLSVLNSRLRLSLRAMRNLEKLDG